MFFYYFSAGGLVTAVAPVVVQGNGLWIGWPGVHLEKDEKLPESDPNDTTPTAGLRSDKVGYLIKEKIFTYIDLNFFCTYIKVIPVDFDHQTFDSYYNGCCNGTFWPLFHSMPDRAQFSVEAWKVIICLTQTSH